MARLRGATGTPAALVAAQNAALGTAVRWPEVGGVLGASGMEVVAGSPDGFARHIAAEQDQWSWIGQNVARDDQGHS